MIRGGKEIGCVECSTSYWTDPKLFLKIEMILPDAGSFGKHSLPALQRPSKPTTRIACQSQWT